MTTKQKKTLLLEAINEYNVQFTLHHGEAITEDETVMREHAVMMQHLSNLYGIAVGRNLTEDYRAFLKSKK